MIYGPVFDTFTDAYLAVLNHVCYWHDHEAAARGKQAVETLNVSFTIRDPTARVPYLTARRVNVVFHHAETLWYLAGRDDLDMIAYYAPGMRRFSADGIRLTGTAYGPRLFAPAPPDGRSQFQRVLALLRAEPGCKRAAMPIMRAEELADPANPDVACTLGLQFLLRGRRLHACAFMRGNDAVVGLLGDTFAFTFIQELTARLLGVELGSYALHVGSMHINKADLPRVEALLAEADQPAPPVRFPATQMPLDTSWHTIEAILQWEDDLRHDRSTVTAAAFTRLPLAPYWREVVMLFEAYRQITHHPDQPVDAATLALLRPGHRWLIERRWPQRMPTQAWSRP